jgi:hypothetical protein
MLTGIVDRGLVHLCPMTLIASSFWNSPITMAWTEAC